MISREETHQRHIDNGEPETVVLLRLHEIIDELFDRKDRGKYASPRELKLKMTLHKFSEYFAEEYDPEILSSFLRKLVDRGSVVTNMDEKGVFPFDAWFIPSTELLDEKEYEIYLKIKKLLIKP